MNDTMQDGGFVVSLSLTLWSFDMCHLRIPEETNVSGFLGKLRRQSFGFRLCDVTETSQTTPTEAARGR